jgi:hypothetical protein
MTIDEALKVAGVSKKTWRLFVGIANDNAKMKDHGWAYLGGMRDALWALAYKNHEVYDTLNDAMPRIKLK